jgi:hypothetical protein
MAQGLYYLARSVGYLPRVSVTPEGGPVVTIGGGKPAPGITAITDLGGAAPEFVYDIETADGTFLSGVGDINVYQTDSLYLSLPDEEFVKADIDYYSERMSKLEYWEEMVRITFEKIVPLNKAVNQMFREDNGTDFLKMAYEECLFPVLFTAKKKYVGTPHVSKPNFDPKVPLFIRGLELKKRGVSEILKNVCNDILKNCVSPDNLLTVMELVQEKIKEIYTMDWTDHFDAFIMTGVYKPNKNNVKMHIFRERMINERNITLTPGVRNNYVVVKKYPFKYDLRGRKAALKVGDKMELADVAREEKMSIDLDYYMEKSINGQLARFVTYHPDFHAEPDDPHNLVEIKKAEDEILKKARKFIDTYCKVYYTNYEDRGAVYKKLYKASAAVIQTRLKSTYVEQDVIKLLGLSVGEEIDEWLLNKVINVIKRKKGNKTYGRDYVEAALLGLDKKTRDEKVLNMQGVYYANRSVNILKAAQAQYNERQRILESRLRKSLAGIRQLYKTNDNIVEMSISYLKSIIDIDNINAEILGEERVQDELENIVSKELEEHKAEIAEGLNKLKNIYYNLLSNYEYIYCVQEIVEYLKTLRNKKIGYKRPPPQRLIDETIDRFIRESVEEDMKSDIKY